MTLLSPSVFPWYFDPGFCNHMSSNSTCSISKKSDSQLLLYKQQMAHLSQSVILVMSPLLICIFLIHLFQVVLLILFGSINCVTLTYLHFSIHWCCLQDSKWWKSLVTSIKFVACLSYLHAFLLYISYQLRNLQFLNLASLPPSPGSY